MNWTANDIDTYQQQKEYIDTLLIPLVKVETTPELLKNGASASDFLMHLSSFIESQFKGRIMLMPPFSYTSSMNKEQLATNLQMDFSTTDFKNIVYVTTDGEWAATALEEDIIWLPAIPLESMDKSLKQSILEDQLKEVLPRLTKKWTK